MTVDFDGQEFKLNSPIITDIEYEYDDEGRCIKSETLVNATLSDGTEEKRISEFFYNENGFKTISKSSKEDKETESIVINDEKGRLSKVETPISIITYEYFDDGRREISRDKMDETVSIKEYKTINGKEKLILDSLTKVLDEDDPDKFIHKTTFDYDVDNDLITVNIRTEGRERQDIFKYSTGDMLSTTRGEIGNYRFRPLKFSYSEDNILTAIVVMDDDGDVIESIPYELKDRSEYNYIIQSKYDSISAFDDGELKYVDRISFETETHPEYFTQNIKYAEYSAAVDNVWNQSPRFSVENENGDYIRYVGGAGKVYMLKFTFDNKVYEYQNTYQYMSPDIKPNVPNIPLYFKPFYLAKISITNLNESGTDSNTREITFKENSTDSALVERFILDKLKQYIEQDNKLGDIFRISKVSLDL